MKKAKRVGIMGGTFDPIHYGHLVAAEAARDSFGLDQVLFVPAARPPHKDPAKVTGAEHRYVMTVLATISNPDFRTSALELNREGPSYAVDTLKEVRSRYGADCRLFFVTGVDAVMEITTWKNLDELLSLADFIAATRPGYPDSQFELFLGRLPPEWQNRFHRLEVPLLAISSSDIRERIRTGRPIKYLLPEGVETYIYHHNLYREGETDVPEPLRKIVRS